MKISIPVCVILACTLSAPIASAMPEAALTKQPMNMEMDKQMPKMQENMEKMQQQMDKLQMTTDEGERQKLMQEHMQSMQKHMKAMRGMGGSMMMGGPKGGAMTDTDPQRCQEALEKRVDMIQLMMEQMMHHQLMGSLQTK